MIRRNISFRSVFSQIAYYAVSVLLLLSLAIDNGYPLLYSDSAAYIASGFDGSVPVDRPVMYSLFVRHLSLATSLWFVIIVQGVLTALVIKTAVDAWIKEAPRYTHVLITTCLSITTGVGYYCGQIMPDIFTGLLIISVAVVFSVKISKASLATLLVLIVFASMTHSSHLLIATAEAFFILLYFIIKKHYEALRYYKWIVLFLLSPWLLIPSLNAIKGAGFQISRAGNVFIMGRLVDSGILQNYLDNECGNSGNHLCSYKEKLPSTAIGFLWDANSPLYSDCNVKGGHPNCWDSKNKEYSTVIKDVFSKGYYRNKFLLFSGSETIKQSYSFNIEGLGPMAGGTPVFEILAWRFPDELDDHVSSKQSSGGYSSPLISKVQNVVILISLVIIILELVLTWKRMSTGIFLGIYASVIGILGNAAVCATFSMVTDRYQGRVIWILALLAAIILVRRWSLFSAGLNRRWSVR